MKKILFGLLAFSIFVAPAVAQDAKPSKKELLKMWSSLPAEGQAKLLDYSKRISADYAAGKNVVKDANVIAPAPPPPPAPPRPNNPNGNVIAPPPPPPAPPRNNPNGNVIAPPPPPPAPPRNNPNGNAVAPTPPPAPTRLAKPPVGEPKAQVINQERTPNASLPKQPQIAEPKRPEVTVTPPTNPTVPVNGSITATPTNTPPNAVKAAPTNPPADNRPDYQVKAESMAKTTIQWDSDKFEFGKINQGDATKHAFKFKNTGANPLQLTYVRPSCGCTATNWTKEVVAPGGEGVVEITFNSAGKQGQQHKTVTVFSNTEPIMQNLQFTGDVVAPEKPAEPAKDSHDSHEGHNH